MDTGILAPRPSVIRVNIVGWPGPPIPPPPPPPEIFRLVDADGYALVDADGYAIVVGG